MCGISGIISKNKIALKCIDSSLKSIKHRGPDDTMIFNADNCNFYASEELSNSVTKKTLPAFLQNDCANIVLGFNRLSIIDTSPNGLQPFYDKNSNTCCAINGEIYNYKELKKEYLQDNILHSATDSEVAFKLYLKFGNDFIHKLRGMFTIVIYEISQHKLKVWRDRLGMKPFFYFFDDNCFIFSSEMKGIFSTSLVKKEVENKHIAYSMYLGTCPAPLTIYKNISSLPAGCMLALDTDSVQLRISRYWSLTLKNINYTDNLGEDISSLAALHDTGSVKKAIMLSGGKDSGILAYYLSKYSDSLSAIILSLSDEKYDEYDYARLNAENAQLPIIKTCLPSKLSKDEIYEYLLTEEEPQNSAEPAYHICKKAAENKIKVLQCAIGPDEIFGGYDYFKVAKKLKYLLPFIKRLPTIFIPSKYKDKIQFLKKFGIASLPFLIRQPTSWENILEILNINSKDIIHPIEFILAEAKNINPDFDKLPVLKQITWLDIFYYIGSHHTFRSDQASMRFSIEMRMPYLDHLFIEKYFNKKDVYHDINSIGKPMITKLAEKILPEKVLLMPKQGFNTPAKKWLINAGINDNNSMQWYIKSLNKIKCSQE